MHFILQQVGDRIKPIKKKTPSSELHSFSIEISSSTNGISVVFSSKNVFFVVATSRYVAIVAVVNRNVTVVAVVDANVEVLPVFLSKFCP